MNTKLNFTGIFFGYTPIHGAPHYVFHNVALQDQEFAFYVKCQSYPEYISKLAPNDLIDVQGQELERKRNSCRLINVQLKELNKNNGENEYAR